MFSKNYGTIIQIDVKIQISKTFVKFQNRENFQQKYT